MRRIGLVLLLAAGCAPQPRPHGPPPGGPHGPGGPGGPERRGVFISPMGEPFRGPGGREVLIGRWFDGADTDHDGKVTLAKFEADAARFFKTLDLDGDGEIDPAELNQYETVIAPEIRVGDAGGGGRSGGGGKRQGGGGNGRHGGGGGGGGHGGGHGGGGGGNTGSEPSGAPHQSLGVQGAARFSFFDLPEPVASADADFNRSITEREFSAAAAQRFALLDTEGDGELTRRELARR